MKGKNIGIHSAGNIAGLSIIEFISLPAKAKISVSFNGETGAEGFVGLRKL
jgi:hypothetical protein